MLIASDFGHFYVRTNSASLRGRGKSKSVTICPSQPGSPSPTAGRLEIESLLSQTVTQVIGLDDLMSFDEGDPTHHLTF